MLVGGPGADVLDGGEDMNEKDNMVPDTSDGAAEGAMVALPLTGRCTRRRWKA